MSKYPEYLYRVFKEEKYALDFAQNGKIWLFSMAKYRHESDELRGDSSEGSANYIARVPEFGNGSNPIGENIANQCYILSAFGPGADFSHMKKFGEYIVKINSPSDLRDDLERFKPQHIISCVLKAVEYTKDKNRIIESREPWLSMTQKSGSYANDCEYRYILQSIITRNYAYEDYLDGIGREKTPPLHIELDFKASSKYLDRLWKK